MEKKSKNLISKNELLMIVCDYFKIDVSVVISKCREIDLVSIRMIYSYIAFKYFRINKSEIARILGGRDHTTIIHALQQCKIRIDKNLYDTEFHINNILDIVRIKDDTTRFEVLPLAELLKLREENTALKLKINEQKKELSKLRTELALEKVYNKPIKKSTKFIDYGTAPKKELIVRPDANYSNKKSLYKELC